MAKKSGVCAFCGRKASEVRLLIQGIEAEICDSCAEQAHAIVKEQFGEEFSDWPDEWIEAAQKMDPTRLADGLRFMVQNRIDSVVENSADIQVLYGRMDQDVTPAMTVRLKDFLPKASFKERPKSGHWPPMMLF